MDVAGQPIADKRSQLTWRGFVPSIAIHPIRWRWLAGIKGYRRMEGGSISNRFGLDPYTLASSQSPPDWRNCVRGKSKVPVHLPAD